MTEDLPEWRYHEPFGYLDSGAPPGSSDFTTLLIIHGSIWHSPVFRKLFPLAHNKNSRVITINRREYPHSKPLDQEDIDLITQGTDKSQGKDNESAIKGLNKFMRDRAVEVLEFVRWLADEKMVVPELEKGSTGTKRGGVVVIGWSAGGRILISMLANLGSFAPYLLELESYIRNLIIYDSAGTIVFGYPAHTKRYIPTEDPSLTLNQRIEAFILWVSGYFCHQSLSLPNEELTQMSLNDLDLEFRTYESDPSPSYLRMSEEERKNNVEPSVANVEGKAELIIARRAAKTGYSEMERREALFNQKNDVWPNLRTHVLWCDMSVAEAAYAAILLEIEIGEARQKGEWVRNVSFVRFKGANHYAHWDEPARTFEVFLKCVQT